MASQVINPPKPLKTESDAKRRANVIYSELANKIELENRCLAPYHLNGAGDQSAYANIDLYMLIPTLKKGAGRSKNRKIIHHDIIVKMVIKDDGNFDIGLAKRFHDTEKAISAAHFQRKNLKKCATPSQVIAMQFCNILRQLLYFRTVSCFGIATPTPFLTP